MKNIYAPLPFLRFLEGTASLQEQCWPAAWRSVSIESAVSALSTKQMCPRKALAWHVAQKHMRTAVVLFGLLSHSSVARAQGSSNGQAGPDKIQIAIIVLSLLGALVFLGGVGYLVNSYRWRQRRNSIKYIMKQVHPRPPPLCEGRPPRRRTKQSRGSGRAASAPSPPAS